MSEISRTDPAARAKNFLSQFKTNPTNREGLPQPLRVRHNIGAMFDVDMNDNSALMSSMARIWKLPIEMRRSLESVGYESKDFDYTINDFVKVLNSMALDSQTQSVRNNLPANLEQSLQVISSILNKELPSPVLEDSSIANLNQQLDELQKEISESNFEDEFKDFLQHHIDALRYSINHYDLVGSDELIARVDEMFGASFRRTLGEQSKSKKILVHRLLDIGAAIIIAMNQANTVIEFSDNFKNFIESGIPVEVEEIDIPKPAQPKKSTTIA